MKKLATIIFAILLLPLVVLADEFKATVVKADRAKNQIVVRTDKGDETLNLKGAKVVSMPKKAPESERDRTERIINS
jgi:hypothetical protein